MKGEDKGDEKVNEFIDSNMLILSGGVFKNYKKGEYIFKEGQQPHFYHQIIKGKVKMFNESDDGKEFIQGLFTSGQSFGEPPIFIPAPYPASAIAAEPSLIIRLSIPSFTQLIRENFDVHWSITQLLAQRIKNKSVALKEITCHNPEQRILSLLNNFKQQKARNGARVSENIKIDYTRKQIADMSGLRIETVIRIMRNLYNKGILTIEKGKVYY
jgi:CRP/FNR family cyclic AMP-dependent transcriptional regulator